MPATTFMIQYKPNDFFYNLADTTKNAELLESFPLVLIERLCSCGDAQGGGVEWSTSIFVTQMEMRMCHREFHFGQMGLARLVFLIWCLFFSYQFGCLPLIAFMPMMFCVRFLRGIGILMKLFYLGLTRAVFSLVLHRLQSMCHLCLGAVRKNKSFNYSVLAVSRNVFECVLMPGCSAFFTFVLCLAQLHVVLHSSFV